MMATTLMNLKILLPFRVFSETKNVSSIVFETNVGAYGLLPQRLDCVSALVPGILTYEAGGTHYLAVDEGIAVKVGAEVWVSVRNAIGGVDLGKLGETVKKQFKQQDESEQAVHQVVVKLESRFISSLDKLNKE